MKRRIFENDAFKVLKSLKNNIPSVLNDKLLDDYHRKCHMLYKEALSYKPPNKLFIIQVVEIHNQFVKEMEKRGFSHTTPLQRI